MSENIKELADRLRLATVVETFIGPDGQSDHTTELGMDAADALEAMAGEVADLGFIAREKEDQLIAANMRCADAEEEVRRMRDDILMRVMSSLAASISLLERGGKAAAPSDRMFDQMLTDYKRNLEFARKALGGDA